MQGLDYTYTAQGWLKAVNGGHLKTEFDRGRDGDGAAGLRRRYMLTVNVKAQTLQDLRIQKQRN